MLPPPGARPSAPVPPAPTPVVAPRRKRALRVAASESTALVPHSRPLQVREEAAFATVETELGGRSQMIAVLSAAKLDKRMDRFLRMLADPDNDKRSLGQLCTDTQLSLAGLLDLFHTSAKARAKAISISRIAKHLPDVASAVMEDAIPGQRTCPTCLGAKQLAAPTPDAPLAMAPCPDCHGLGEVRHTPDHEVQRTALKLGELLNEGKGSGTHISMAMLQQAQGKSGGIEYDSFLSLMDGLLYGRGRERFRSGPVAEGEEVTGEESDP